MTKNPPLVAFSYLELYKQNPELARATVLQVIRNNPKLAVSKVASICSCSRTTIYDILSRDKDPTKSLLNRSTRPKNPNNQTSSEIEELVVNLRKQSNFGSRRISVELARNKDIKLHKNTVYKILKRNNLNFRVKRKSKNKELRDYYHSPFRFIEIDIKEVKDTTALPKEVYEHVDKCNLPNYQFTATDTFTRMRWISYGYQKTFTNGFGFLFYILLQLRQSGITQEIRFQTDNGQEFGGFEEKKIRQIDEQLQLFNCRFTHIPKAQKYKQGHVERSHRTDDEEFYIPHLQSATDTKSLLKLASQWVWHFNTDRPHQGKYLNDQTPFEYALRLQTDGYQKEVKTGEINENGYEITKEERFYLPKEVKLDKLKLIPVLLLDNVSVELIFYYNKMLDLLRKINQSDKSIKSEAAEVSSKSVQDVRGYYLSFFL